MKKKIYLFIFIIVVMFILNSCNFNDKSINITTSRTDNAILSSVSEIEIASEASKTEALSTVSNSASKNQNTRTSSISIPVPKPAPKPIQEQNNTSKTIDTLDEQRKMIENTYNVEILYGEETFFDYNTDLLKLKDPNYIKIGLTNLDHELSRYPNGFFAEFSRKLRIFLITSFSDQYSGMASYENPGYFDLYLSTSPDSVRTLNHELMHMIDFTMQEKTGYSGFSNWDNLNPQGFEYTGQDYSENNYVFDKVKNISFCYFVTNYSLKSCFEDRAEIFENLMMNEDVNCYTSSNNPIYRKIKYLNSEIRRVFKSVQKTTITEWEKNIN